MKKIVRRILLCAIVLLVVLMAGAFYLLDYALCPADMNSRSRNIDSSFQLIANEYPQESQWLDSVMVAGALHDIYIEDDNGLNHHALYIPAAIPNIPSCKRL